MAATHHLKIAHEARDVLLCAGAALLDLPPAIVLAGLGCVFLAASSDLANTFDAPWHGGTLVAALLCISLGLAFASFLLAARRELPHPIRAHWRTLRWLSAPILLWAAVTAAQTPGIIAHGLSQAQTQRTPHYGSDDLYYNQYNALLTLHGKNPYAGSHLLDEVAYFGALDYTPLRRGRFANPRHYPTKAERDAVMEDYLAHPDTVPPEIDPRTAHSYPAGAFLVDMPFVWAGLPNIALPQTLIFLVAIGAIIAASPTGIRLVVALLLLATADGARQAVGGDFEIWPLAALLGAWLLRERRWASAALLGAACAIKQTAWLAAPFYLIWVWRTSGRDEALRRGGIAVAVFAVINLPWIVASPGAWLESVALPVSLPLLPDGSGIAGLGIAGIGPLAPPAIYGALEVAALAAALLWFWRAEARYPFAGLVLPLVPLFFAWRSSERYFVLLPLAGVLAAVLTVSAARREKAADSRIAPGGL